jgi:hypothetical protein
VQMMPDRLFQGPGMPVSTWRASLSKYEPGRAND